ncbi:aldo/keto reductase [Carboxylicivirga sp. M1479]|uniref:aldo/keto reductase n=1 Tax=Carboxylicivirga sp. M1479 TaxID=2594476 RepID=UPI0011788772|nr:aldo/keto reductase [Carboxylicivirga sp. M1479]TRX72611.1 4Fe-4S dicluster domain-containing protein [Carboxylicivirga sp. M1479]
MDRRKFLTRTGQSLALLNVAGLASAAPTLSKEYKNVAPEDIIYRTLGRTGLQVPVVSMGVMNANIPGLIVRSYDKGIRLFDTAWYYQNGMNEKMLGETLDKHKLRDDVKIVTKVYLKETERDLYQPEIKAVFIERFEESLRRLKTDYVDVLIYHAASTIEEQNNPFIIEALTELKAAGKYKHCAVSLHGDDAALIDDVREKGFYDIIMVMFNIAYADDLRLQTAMQKAAEAGHGIIAMKTQCGGGGYMWWEKHEDSRQSIGTLNHTAMLKWVLQHDYIATAIPGYTTYEQLDENFSVADNLAFTTQERDFLDKAHVQLAQSFCVQCSQCVNSCPHRNDIPTLMRTYMYAYQYDNMQQALATEKAMPRKYGLANCKDCGQCSAQCKRSLNLSQRIEALKELNFQHA